MQMAFIKSVIYQNRRDVKRQLFDELNSVTYTSLATVDKYNKIMVLSKDLGLTKYIEKFNNKLPYSSKDISVNRYHYITLFRDYITNLLYEQEEKVFNNFLTSLEIPTEELKSLSSDNRLPPFINLKSDVVYLEVSDQNNNIKHILILGKELIFFNKLGVIECKFNLVDFWCRYLHFPYVYKVVKIEPIKIKVLKQK